jgi:antitoxin component of MazEF toxin-antitoxin module
MEIKYKREHQITKYGDSLAITLTEALRKLGWKEKDKVNVIVENSHIKIEKEK